MSDQYRLSWESPSAIDCATIEAQHGKDAWQRIPWDMLTSWHQTEKITDNPWQQYNQLKAWAESREQPIRNVKLERRPVPQPDEGWEQVDDPEFRKRLADHIEADKHILDRLCDCSPLNRGGQHHESCATQTRGAEMTEQEPSKPLVMYGMPLCFNCGAWHHGRRSEDCPDIPGKVRDNWSND